MRGSSEKSEMDKSSKEGKETKESRTSDSQAQNSATSGSVTAEWAAYQVPPPGFLASSSQPHPYMWGVQQFMPPFSTPPHPYVAMYPPGGIYAHPSIPPGSYPFSPFAMPSPNGIAEASPNTPGYMELDGKSSEGKEKLPNKVSKGNLSSLNMVIGKDTEPGKTSGASANGLHSKSGEIASKGSGEGANSQDDSQMKSGGLQDSAETSENGSADHGSHNGGPNTHSMVNQALAIMPMAAAGSVAGVPPATNLNIGMDYWGTATPSSIPAMRGKVPSLGAGGMVNTGSQENVPSQLWMQDERELKRQRRKQSNRASARLSRLRKQAECDELAQRSAVLEEENTSLRAEVAQIRSEYEQLRAQNASLKEKLGESSSQDDPRCSRDSGQADNQQSGQ